MGQLYILLGIIVFFSLLAVFVYGFDFSSSVSVCDAEDRALSRGAFADLCDDITGFNVEINDDSNIEAHSYQQNKYAGLRIQSVNISNEDCDFVDYAEVCYEWWINSNATDCDVSVDADGGLSYTAVTAICPGTSSNPGVICTDVTSMEEWNCRNFFGAYGTRGLAKSELERDAAGPARIATWDVFYFNVNYTALPFVCGDCDGNSFVDVADALRAARYSVGLAALTPGGFNRCDVNNDRRVSVIDSQMIMQYIIGRRLIIC